MTRARILIFGLTVILLTQTVACNRLGETTTQISPKLIDIQYPNGMTVINGQVLTIILENRNMDCVSFPVTDGIPIQIYINNSTMPVGNALAYAWPAIKMTMINTVSSRRKIEVAPFLDPNNAVFILPIYSAYIPLEGSVCDDPNIKISKKIPFFIQNYSDY